ncbi:hypothetical protein FD723_39655 (plasmid) [Nostoc sp. C052]|uniref:hypothetical protein n=1 Tax=Nostoc sp. C052 TaxID=2576902 RepID=UPI0015C34327|nr:hypothetical protein [Nostoc sp. C052]QLE46328.1 hypothetical protein FD723_39655 [Nostoc sp. C052]
MHNILETIVLAIVEILCSEKAKSAIMSQPYVFTAIKVNIRFLTVLLIASIAFIFWIAIAVMIPVFARIIILLLPTTIVAITGVMLAFFALIFAKSFLKSFQEKGVAISSTATYLIEESNPSLEAEEYTLSLLREQTIEQLRNLITQLNSSGGEQIQISPHNNKNQLIHKIINHQRGSKNE